jgi:hypothetical protein
VNAPRARQVGGPALATLPRRRPERPPVARVTRRRARIRPSEPVALFLASAALYLATAALLGSRNIVFADAMSRVGNAYYVLFSRYPHLPAIGFVWNPLPSLVLLAVLPLKPVAPWLVTRGLAGALQSALTMAATVAVLASCLRKLRVPVVPRRVLIGLFAIQPMIMLYAGSGLSEAMLLLFLAVTTSCLISWLHGRAAGALVGAGLALGLAYLTRYEAVAPALSVAVLVGVVSWRRAGGPRSARLTLAANDVLLVAAPFAFAFGMWTAMSRMLVGQWLPTFSSVYGNSAQVRSGASSIRSVTGGSVTATLGYLSRQVDGLAPLFVVLVVLAAAAAWYLRDPGALAGPAVFGAVSAFNALVLVAGGSFGWLRFQITVIPLSTLLAGTAVTALAEATRRRPTRRRHRVAGVLGAGVAAAVALAVPAQARILTDTTSGLAREESPMLHSAISPASASHEERRSLLIFKTEREIAAYLDRLDPGEGTVLADTAYAYSVVMSSAHPRQFVITSDLDFPAAVADPAGHGVRYLLVPAPELGRADALRARWPTLYEDGAGIATLVRTFNGAYFGDWRLYRVR